MASLRQSVPLASSSWFLGMLSSYYWGSCLVTVIILLLAEPLFLMGVTLTYLLS